MSGYHWGDDPGFVEDSRGIQRKLFWLALLSSAGGLAFAVNHWMFGEPGFHWIGCVIASLCGATVFAFFSKSEGLPIAAAMVAGVVAGAGAYTASANYILYRQSILVLELLIPSLVGSGPGIVLYIILVRIYHGFTD